ncbi:ribose-5-phosphate isomerase [Luteococcus peritonei]|uniref:Ribose-5-phosphate isomerase n=1 Tax=Luteococcus peritonei TaxID=88874 RepID=A0ABW4RZN6_9ACTN
MGYRVAVGADIAGVEYKDLIKSDLAADERIDEVIDCGVAAGEDVDYPHVGVKVAKLVADGSVDRAVLVCGTGMGMAISANKVPGVRACTAHDSFSVERLVLSNDAQVLCLGQRVIGPFLARRLAKEFFGYDFDPSSSSAPKVAAISSYEAELGGTPDDAPASC